MSRKSKLLALLTMSFLLAILVPAAAYAAPQGGELAAQSLQAQRIPLDPVSNIKSTVEANSDGTFYVRFDFTGGVSNPNETRVALYDGRTKVNAKVNTSESSTNYKVFTKVPTEYAGKTLTARFYNYANTDFTSIYEDSA